MGILRLLLAVCVLVAHSNALFGMWMIGGQLAVQSFFMISGFYMALVLNEKYGPGLTQVFLANRFLRLFPVYFVVLVGSFLLQITMPAKFVNIIPPEHSVAPSDQHALNAAEYWQRDISNLKITTTAYLLATNLATIGQESLQFFAIDAKSGAIVDAPPKTPQQIEAFQYMFVPQAWSIGVELLFYMAAPFIVRRNAATLVGIIACSIALRVVLFKFGYRGNPWNDRIFPLELAFFLVGALGYKFYRSQKAFIESHRAISIALMATTLFIVVAFPHIPLPSMARRILLFGSVAASIPFLFSLTRKNSIDRYIGELSYPFYLTHVIVLMGLASAQITSSFVAAIITLLVSIVLYHSVDSPIDAFRQRFARRKTDALAPPASKPPVS